jgi:hypothetical protein
MPFLMSTGNPGLPEIINVEQAVGRGGPNSPEDVKLVQLFLKKIFTSPKWSHFLSTWALSGICDEMTTAGIHFFQASVRAVGGSSAAFLDQRVDRATKGGIGPVHHSVYTIVNLNSLFAQSYPGEFAIMVSGLGGLSNGILVKSG